MEIYAEVESFTFYQSSKTFYISANVIEKRLKPGCISDKEKFEEVKIKDSISLKVTKKKLDEVGKITAEEISYLLLTRFLIFDVDKWQAPISWNKNSTPKFLVSSARKCGIFLET